MPTVQEQLQKAKFKFDSAYHLLHVTFPLIQDPRLLLGVLENTYVAMETAMEALLQKERERKTIPAYGHNFYHKFMALNQLAKKHNISSETIKILQQAKEILELHKKSPVEFRRGGTMVICTADYEVKTITQHDLREYLQHAQTLLDKTETIINRKA